jgi:hypothetical protein
VLIAAVVWHSAQREASSALPAFRRGPWLEPLNYASGTIPDAMLWSGASGGYGEQTTLFHEERRVVRVLDREYAVPARGETLVLLIDERRTPVRVESRILPQPVAQRARQPAESLGAADRSRRANARATWRQLLASDPIVAAFVAAAEGPTPGEQPG